MSRSPTEKQWQEATHIWLVFEHALVRIDPGEHKLVRQLYQLSERDGDGAYRAEIGGGIEDTITLHLKTEENI